MAESAMPAPSGKRTCGMCGRGLSQYNKDDICMSHSAADVLKYREKQKADAKSNKQLRDFVGEFHKAGTVSEMFEAAEKKATSEKKKIAAIELQKYAEAMGVLKVTSMVFRLSMPTILRIRTVQRSHIIARNVAMYVMRNDLEMTPEEIAVFFGYSYVPNVSDAVRRIAHAYLDDEDIILAVDLVRFDFNRMSEND